MKWSSTSNYSVIKVAIAPLTCLFFFYKAKMSLLLTLLKGSNPVAITRINSTDLGRHGKMVVTTNVPVLMEMHILLNVEACEYHL